jgi:TPR repeat protein
MWAALAIAALLSATAAVRGIAAESECPEGERWLACEAKRGDPQAMYAVGRLAYEEGRKSGDFAVALDWARKLAAKKHENGERLLKMVYLELGWGNHKDFVQGYVWLNEAIARGDEYLIPWLKMLMEKMSPEQLAEAKKRLGG